MTSQIGLPRESNKASRLPHIAQRSTWNRGAVPIYAWADLYPLYSLNAVRSLSSDHASSVQKQQQTQNGADQRPIWLPCFLLYFLELWIAKLTWVLLLYTNTPSRALHRIAVVSRADDGGASNFWNGVFSMLMFLLNWMGNCSTVAFDMVISQYI